ncbi:hypothetical protein V6N11_047071 [Hibiscus sabdariffa]|uniref:Uncharacterized protein n=2 Tax=Hibiscus sabdariffa TaxID=183260 RepID=A0ABR1ZY36_9ROSI
MDSWFVSCRTGPLRQTPPGPLGSTQQKKERRRTGRQFCSSAKPNDQPCGPDSTHLAKAPGTAGPIGPWSGASIVLLDTRMRESTPGLDVSFLALPWLIICFHVLNFCLMFSSS